jgi:hypothetical protein
LIEVVLVLAARPARPYGTAISVVLDLINAP